MKEGENREKVWKNIEREDVIRDDFKMLLFLFSCNFPLDGKLVFLDRKVFELDQQKNENQLQVC